MSRRRLLLAIASSVAAVAVLFMLYRTSPATSPGNATAVSNPSAESGTARPASRAASGDSKTVIEQTPDSGLHSDTRQVQGLDARTIETCHYALLGKKYIGERVEGNCGGIAEDDDVGMQLCRRALEGDYAYLQELTAKAAGCPEALASASGYYEALRDAALTGDVYAQQCFLAGYFKYGNSGDVISRAQRDEYLSLAKRFMQSAFERADWGLVHRLAGTYEDDPGMLIEAFPYGSGYPETRYKMNYLITLSSGDQISSKEARRLVNHFRSTGRLSTEQSQAAEEWARETYDRYFAGTPYIEQVAKGSFCKTD